MSQFSKKKNLEKIPATRMTHPRIQISYVSESLRQKSSLHIPLILILGLLVYSNTFHVPFQWDEEKFIIKNPLMKDLSYFAAPSKARGHELYRGLKNRYIGYLTFALNYRINRFDVPGYHVVNVIIHLSNALLVYSFVILLFRTPF